MNYKLINRLDPLIYLGLVLVGFILPEVVYRIFLFDFSAVLTENEAMIVRSIGGPLYFAAMAFFLLGGNAENGNCLLYTSPSPRDLSTSRMPSSA